ncbi:hypothetical protein BCV72DRAFT_199354 [Rhizopus microsporus var. microsporus]|uniref:Uncharacterized protein n=1 Tax=Rhizopus microsporus var. microsporus TaxID=86635 RepID=A0A1X0REP3_RHIZD|nr:hypothetical protein BCV72DRAFT_199354 [Rhizopus microsporus var. microsporus]
MVLSIALCVEGSCHSERVLTKKKREHYEERHVIFTAKRNGMLLGIWKSLIRFPTSMLWLVNLCLQFTNVVEEWMISLLTD